jgi:hypothetical protein
MAVKFNSRLSGRKQISPDSVDITFNKNDENQDSPPTIKINKFVNENELDPKAELVLRVKDQRDYIAVSCGTVEKPTDPPPDVLKDFIRTSYRYQLRVVSKDPSKKALILGATSFKTTIVDERDLVKDGMLPFLRADIDPFLWELDIREVEGPILRANKNVPDIINRFRDDPMIQISILPTVTRDILKAVYINGPRDLDQKWKIQWDEWAKSKNQDVIPGSGDDDLMNSWIERVVEISMEKNGLINAIKDDRKE